MRTGSMRLCLQILPAMNNRNICVNALYATDLVSRETGYIPAAYGKEEFKMKQIKRTALRIMITVLVLASLPALPALASSSKVKCYTISSGKTTVYENSSLTRKSGTLTGSDEIKVLSVSRKHCKISYTGKSGKKKTGYISTKAILCGTDGETCKVKVKLKAYRRPKGKSCGSIPTGSKVKILGRHGKYTQVRYSGSGSTRFVFVKTDSLKAARK